MKLITAAFIHFLIIMIIIIIIIKITLFFECYF